MHTRAAYICSLAIATTWLACSSASKDEGPAASAGSSGDSSRGAAAGAESLPTGGQDNAGGAPREAAGGVGADAGAENGAAGAGDQDGVYSCSSGVLFAGDPLYNDKPDAGAPKPSGQDLLDDPPIRNEAMAVIGKRVFIETEQEIWSVDTSAAHPRLTRMAGQEDAGVIDAGGSCADTRFLVIRDMVATSDGRLVVVDFVGGAVIEITNPGEQNCKSHWVAGTHSATPDPGPDYPLSHGDHDGPGSEALFGGDEPNGAGIHKLASDSDGNLYTWDDGTGKFKKIANDAERTVSTIGQGSAGDNIMGLAWLGGKLYATGVDGTDDFLIEVAVSDYDAGSPKANVHDVFRNHGEQFPEIAGSGHQAIPAQLVNDGEALIVSGQSGYVWRLAPDGTVLATLAGSGAFIDYQGGFDPLEPHPATEWQLVSSLSNADGGPWLALGDGTLYWSGGIGIGKYVLGFSCP